MGAIETDVTRTYGNWSKPSTAGLFGLGKIGTIVLLAGLVLSILVMMAGKLLAALGLLVVLGVVLGLVQAKDMHGKSIMDKMAARVGWRTARVKGAHLYRSGPLGFALWGTHQLPGIAAALRVSEHKDPYGRTFVLIHSPMTSTYSVVLATEPEGAHLVDKMTVDERVADWGQWLANLSDEPGLQACAVTVETGADTGHRLRNEVDGAMDPGAPEFAKRMLRQVVDTYPAGSSTITAYVSLTFGASTMGGKKRSAEQMGRDLASRIPGLTASLAATGAGAVSPLSAQELCEIVRTAYDPDIAPVIQQAQAAGEMPSLSWTDVGPVAAEAEWGGYRHDGAYSVSYQMSRAPRSHVQSRVLGQLLAPHASIARKRVSLLYRPIDSGKAAAMVEADLATAQFNATSGSRKTSARAARAVKSSAATAHEEASGAGLVNFAMLVTATVMDEEKLPEARAAIDQLSGTAKITLRPVYGGQAAAFAAGLPLGLVLPKHLSAAASVRKSL